MTTPRPPVRTSLVIGLGLGAGLLSGLFGVGGGILVVPVLVLLLKFDQRLANGTSLGAVLPISISSLLTYWSHGNVDWNMALWLAVGALAGAILGTKWIHILPKKTLGYLFAAMLLITAVRLFIPLSADGRSTLTIFSALALIVIGLVTGTLAGLLGIGGGVVMVPAMAVFFSELSVVAKGTSAAVIIPTSIMGTWRNWKTNNVDLKVAALVGFSGIPAAIAGGIIADHMSQDLSNILFASLVLVVALRMIWDLQKNPSD
ncbi:MAG: TSUP family transporter [Actinobacteria bacterium]|nr:TSUP family transporter [Actinomycetota bacterium]